MKITVNQLVQQLGISQAEANALDKLDGKQDGVLKDSSVFGEANKLLNMEKFENEDEAISFFARLSDVGKAIAKTLAVKLGIESYVYNNEKGESVDIEYDNDDTVLITPSRNGTKVGEGGNIAVIGEIMESAKEYLDENGTLEGFKFSGLPQGVSKISINWEGIYDNVANDEVTIDAEGNGIIEKVIDGVLVEIRFTMNDKEYVVGSIERPDEE